MLSGRFGVSVLRSSGCSGPRIWAAFAATLASKVRQEPVQDQAWEEEPPVFEPEAPEAIGEHPRVVVGTDPPPHVRCFSCGLQPPWLASVSQRDSSESAAIGETKTSCLGSHQNLQHLDHAPKPSHH